MPDQLLPTRSVPSYANNPEYQRLLQQRRQVQQVPDPRYYPPQAPPTNMTLPGGRAVSIPAAPGTPPPGPARVRDPRYIPPNEVAPMTSFQRGAPTTVSPSFHGRNAMGAAEGPMLDGMRASELFYDRPVPQLRSGRDVSAEGPLLDDMMAAELFKRAEVQRAAQEYEAEVQRARANQTFENVNRRPEIRPFQTFENVNRDAPRGLGVPSDDIRAMREREEMVRRMEAQGYGR